LITVSVLLGSIGINGLLFHIVSLLVKAHYSVRSAGLVLGCINVTAGIGSVAFGAGADRFGIPRILPAALLCGAIGALTLLGIESRYGAIWVTTFVLLWGAIHNVYGQAVPTIIGERFGTRKLGTLMGLVFAIAGGTGAAAPIVTGFLYDRFGNYEAAIVFSALALLGSCLFISLLIRPRVQILGTQNELD
jgi:MFS family permease